MKTGKPEWLKIRIQGGENSSQVKKMLESLSLHTVCEEAACPNRMECFGKKTATFMILGKTCTRNCSFCNVGKGTPLPPAPLEPIHVAQAVSQMGLRHAVITSVTRDDLDDGGAAIFAETIREVRKLNPGITVEVLIPDFRGEKSSLEKVIDASPDIINHNIETVSRLYREVRPGASYKRSLELIQYVKSHNIKTVTKSGIMAGLGESEEELVSTFRDLVSFGCDLLTIGQYLSPSAHHHPVVEYIRPERFEFLREKALEAGFRGVASGPFVRSSYMAEDLYSSTLRGK